MDTALPVPVVKSCVLAAGETGTRVVLMSSTASADELRADLAEWAELEQRADEDRMAIYLRPIIPSGLDDCDRIPPGYDYGVPID